MELRHLRYFVAVAEELHFGRAAKRLHITQPPLSQQIQLLERQLGVKLLLRGRKLALTEAGHVFLDEARHTIDVADRAARAARAAAAGSATQLRVGYPTTTLSDLAPAVLRTFAERFSDIGVEAFAGSTSELLSALSEDQADVAFVFATADDNGSLCFDVLLREPLVLALPEAHKLAARDTIFAADLVNQMVILVPRSLAPIEDQLLHVLDGPPEQHEHLAHADTLESTYSAVAAGLGVALVPASTARAMTVCAVVHRAFGEDDPALELSVAWRSRPGSSLVRSFVGLAKELAVRPEQLVTPVDSGCPRCSLEHLRVSCGDRTIGGV